MKDHNDSAIKPMVLGFRAAIMISDMNDSWVHGTSTGLVPRHNITVSAQNLSFCTHLFTFFSKLTFSKGHKDCS